ncbi:MAG TPA: hypothetical protein VM938_02050 [Acidimicrobiales bacterium]|nr:hypothetical protein [Acidimicrobiales bacterium]
MIASGMIAAPSRASEPRSLDEQVRALAAALPLDRLPFEKALIAESRPVAANRLVQVAQDLPSTIRTLRAETAEQIAALEQLRSLVTGDDFQEGVRGVAEGLAWMGDKHLELASDAHYVSWAVNGLFEGQLTYTAAFDWMTFARIFIVVGIVSAMAIACIFAPPTCPAAVGLAAVGLLANAGLVLAELEAEARRSEGQVTFRAHCPGAFLCAVDEITTQTISAGGMSTLDVRFFPTNVKAGATANTTYVGGYGCYNSTGGVYTPYSGSAIGACFTKTVAPYAGVMYQQKPGNTVFDNSPAIDWQQAHFMCSSKVAIQVMATWTTNTRASFFLVVPKAVHQSCV